MSQQTIRQQARRTAREMAERRRRERQERERRVIARAEQVLVAIGQRDAAVAEAEKRAGEALRELTVVEGLFLGEAVEWCGETVTVREATRLRLAAIVQDDRAPATTATAESGERVPARRLDDAAAAKAAYRDGPGPGYRPWITEPGLWLQFDWGAGPIVFGPDGRPRATLLFCACLAWSRFGVVLPTWDRKLGTRLTCLDATLRRIVGRRRSC